MKIIDLEALIDEIVRFNFYLQHIRISKRALQEWEQGGRQPDSAARAYLTVIAKEPAVVRRALATK